MPKRTPNTQLKDLLAEGRLTYESTARSVRAVAAERGEHLQTNKSAVHHWVSYGAVPDGPTAHCLAEALSRRLGRRITLQELGLPSPPPGEDDSIGLTLGPDPVEVLTTIGEADMHRRRFLTASAYSMAATVLPLAYVKEMAERTAAARSGAAIGAAEVAAVRDMVGLFTEMDERLGGQHGRAAFVQYLITDITPLCKARFHNEDLRRQMLSVASSAAHLAGWKAYDSGEQGLAQRYYLQSFALAVQSGEPGQDGFVMRTMSQQGMKLHRPEHCLDLAASALARAHDQVPAPAQALFHITHAHALAKTGQRRQAVAEIEAARTALDTGRGDQVPFWALAWGPPEATVGSRTAKVFEDLGDHRRASQYYAHAAASRPAGCYARIVALDLVAAAESQLKQGGIEEACATWNRAMDHMDGVRSVRTRKAVNRMRSDLVHFRARGVRSAAELEERAVGFLAAA
ncbi:hypothetical protein JK364_30985 [Streptomyces sp. 110]|uniref:Tetratricopeptide repeat protein n=1 Tax=Streptomyces endocoffeicus TaxID=2898945 RepID=A0ABS1PWI6_9ACTN|nr:hypothetical protein [Streptomyces endocoffeicus]MBL1116779.1 hypothetical protein [Streptomyces endocoffeicus]